MESSTMKTAAYLTQIYGEDTSKKYKLMCTKVTIGRSVHADIRLPNLSISRNHCVLFFNGNGWTIMDNKSQNGTYISGRKLKPGESRPLQCGDIIFLGPPAEMPEAFCFDDAFVDDEDIPVTGHEIIVLSGVKRRAEEQITTSKKKILIRTESDVESNKIIPPAESSSPIKATQAVSQCKEMFDSSNYSNMKDDEMEVVTHENATVKSTTNSKLLSQLNKYDSDSESLTSNSLIIDSPSKKPENSDSGYQINEISSTGDDQAGDSESLLDIKKNNADKPSCSSFSEGRKSPTNVQDSNTSKEIDLLKSKLALVTDQMKKIEESKINLLKNYEVVCEKNFALDQQLAEKKKIEEDLKSCEQKVHEKIKNDLLEKFEEDLICNICTELLIKPTVLDCSHTFCQHCIKEWKKKKNECPICRNKIQTMTPVLTLEHFIDKTLATLTPEQKERRNQLIKEREKKPEKVATPSTKRNRRRRNSRAAALALARRLVAPQPLTNSQRTINPLSGRLITHSNPQNNGQSDVTIVAERRSNLLPLELSPFSFQSVLLRIPDRILNNGRSAYDAFLG